MEKETIDLSIVDLLKKKKKVLDHHNNLFFNKNKSVISDSDYDILLEEFHKLLEEHPEEANLVTDGNKMLPVSLKQSSLALVKHPSPMRSIQHRLFDYPSLETQFARHPSVVEPVYESKLDGLALEIHYEQGNLVRILTKGDEVNGEDVTHALPLFNNIPTKLPLLSPDNLVVRGEGFITNSNFVRYNEAATTPAKNQRNAVSGWVRTSAENQNEEVLGLLSFYVYWCDNNFEEHTYRKVMDKVVQLGFEKCPEVSLLHIRNNVRSTTLPTDGIVIKLFLKHEFSFIDEQSYMQLAYKYPAETGDSPVLAVTWQVGRTGYATPVALYEPIMLMGVECQKASLHNYRQFISHGLRIGSVVRIARRGDVIPHVVGVVDKGKGKAIHAPKECPSCGEPLVFQGENNEEVYLRCLNVTGCPAQIGQRCYNLADKTAFDIKGIGLVTLVKLIEEGIIKQPADIFKLQVGYVNQGVYDRIRQARNITFDRFIKSLSLPEVGVTIAGNIAEHVKDPAKLLGYLNSVEKLTQIKDIGKGIALGISVAVDDEDFLKNYYALLDEVNIIPAYLHDPGYTHQVCITGTTSRTRAELEEFFAKHEIELKDRLTKMSNCLLVGSDPGKNKLAMAEKYQKPVIDINNAPDLMTIVKLIKEV